MAWFRRLLNTIRPGKLQRDIKRELSFHLAERADELRTEGSSAEEATRRAKLQLGNPSLYVERTRDEDVAVVMDAFLRNLRFALRALGRTPMFTATVVLTLAGEVCRGAVSTSSTGSVMEILVNRRFAERYFPSRSVVGLHLTWEEASLSGPIFGIVEDARERGIDDAAVPTVYSCNAAPNPFPWLLARTKGDPELAVGAIRAKLEQIEPLRSVFDAAPLEARIGDAFAQNRLRTVLLGLFAVTALALACLGVYATLGYVVSLRRREVGLRLALGALRRDIVVEIVAQGLRVVVPACLSGLLLSVAFGRALSGMLYGVSPSDPGALAGAVAVVLTVAVLAALAPAMQAARVEPTRVLRQE
jgi:hypothetical protein